jgi:hypothetical protein
MRAAAATVALVALLGPGTAFALPPSLDTDQDGHLDGIEIRLGSDPADATRTPESVAVAGTCLDGNDNDGDGASDGDDPGCTAPVPSDVTFPGAGEDAFDSSLSLEAYPFAIGTGICTVSLEGSGPVVVQRGAPAGSPASFAVEIVAMQLRGTATVSDGSGCGVPPGSYDLTIVESPDDASTGIVTDTDADPATNFPADSFFDVFFDVVVKLGDTEVVFPGGPPNGPPGAPVRVANTIRTIPPYQGGKNSLCYQVPGLTHEHCPKAPPDHYTCYTGKFSPKFAKREVTLRDQFDTTSGTPARVLKPAFLCNPTAKNGEPLYEPTGHLACYRLKPKKTERTVTVRNQFGQKSITTKKSTLLCLPTEKNAEGQPEQLDHFKCYSAKFPKTTPRTVTLVDQFGTRQEQVTKPLVFCNPVSKNGEPIRNPLTHLECYAIQPQAAKQTVSMRNQFGEQTVKTKKTAMLCLPSGKTEAVTTTTTTQPGGSTTTTTLPGITVMLGWTHPTPGVPPSRLCGKVNGPPNANGMVQISGPTPGTTSVSLNGQGVGRFNHQIFSFGTYTADVTVGDATGSAMATVNASDPGCP